MMISHRTLAIVCAGLLGAGAVLTAVGSPEREVSLASAGELWADLFRDADQFGLQLSRVSTQEEIALGKRIAAGITTSNWTSPWEPYVRSVGQSLARNVARKDIPYEFHVIAAPVVNAFALPGGQIFVYEGLLQQMHTEAELAAVLGHEIGHVDARHCVERYQYQLRLQHLGIGDVHVLATIAQEIIRVGYAQYQELEADAIGERLAVGAGYDPHAVIQLFSRVFLGGQPQPKGSNLEDLFRLPASMATDYFRSHPPTQERVRRLSAWVAAYERKHKGESAYRGEENFKRQIPRQQQEFPNESIRL